MVMCHKAVLIKHWLNIFFNSKIVIGLIETLSPHLDQDQWYAGTILDIMFIFCITIMVNSRPLQNYMFV